MRNHALVSFESSEEDEDGEDEPHFVYYHTYIELKRKTEALQIPRRGDHG